MTKATAASKKKKKSSTTAAAKKKNKNKNDVTSHKSKETFVLCPYTDQKVWIGKATVKELKASSSSSSKTTNTIHKSGHKKRLWTISSSQIRYEHYDAVCQALSLYEQNLLPSSGGRSWEVSVTLSESNGRALFRSYKGRMELACFPHLIDRIPVPPIWPGKRGQPTDDYELMEGMERDNDDGHQCEYIQSLMKREVSMLSRMAWEVLRCKKHGGAATEYPAPTVAVHWKAPDGKSFTSRKSAWEHARHLSCQEVQIERTLSGIGASGKLLKEFVPTAKASMEVGQLRFVRDGLWVVGQELAWQADRADELKQQEEKQETEEAEKVYTTGLQLYLATNRNTYRDEHVGINNKRLSLAQADKGLRMQWRCMAPQEQHIWNNKVDDSNDDDESMSSSSSASEEEISCLEYFVRQRREAYRYEQQIKLMNTENERIFKLAQADRELRKQWREMDETEQDAWISKLEKEEEEKLEGTASKVCDEEGKNNIIGKEMVTKEEQVTGECGTAIASSTVDDDGVLLQRDTAGKDELVNNKTNEVSKDGTRITLIKEADGSYQIKAVSVESNPTFMEISNEMATACVKDENSAACSSPTKKLIDATSSKSKVGVVKLASNKKASSKKGSKSARSASTKKQATKRKRCQGTQKFCLQQKQMDLCLDACQEHYESVMRTVKARDLARELADGFDVFRERGRGRFDMELPAFDSPTFDFLNNFEKTPWMPIVKAILGDDVILIHKGCFISLPGAEIQVYHQDGVHLTTQSQRPCHAINVFVPLVDLNSRNGPTEFVLGSHVLGQEGYDKDFLCTPKTPAGTPIIFDYRLGHRGMGNSSHLDRPVVYCTYARASDGKAFSDKYNFSRKRYHKIGELSAKPLSREERRNKRKRSIESLQEKGKRIPDVKDDVKVDVSTSSSPSNHVTARKVIKSYTVDHDGASDKVKEKELATAPIAVSKEKVKHSSIEKEDSNAPEDTGIVQNEDINELEGGKPGTIHDKSRLALVKTPIVETKRLQGTKKTKALDEAKQKGIQLKSSIVKTGCFGVAKEPKDTTVPRIIVLGKEETKMSLLQNVDDDKINDKIKPPPLIVKNGMPHVAASKPLVAENYGTSHGVTSSRSSDGFTPIHMQQPVPQFVDPNSFIRRLQVAEFQQMQAAAHVQIQAEAQIQVQGALQQNQITQLQHQQAHCVHALRELPGQSQIPLQQAMHFPAQPVWNQAPAQQVIYFPQAQAQLPLQLGMYQPGKQVLDHGVQAPTRLQPGILPGLPPQIAPSSVVVPSVASGNNQHFGRNTK